MRESKGGKPAYGADTVTNCEVPEVIVAENGAVVEGRKKVANDWK